MGDASSGEIPETNGVPELGGIPDRTGDIGADKGSGSISGQSVPGHMKHRDQVMPGNWTVYRGQGTGRRDGRSDDVVVALRNGHQIRQGDAGEIFPGQVIVALPH